jgi:hypothetical protein
MKERHEVEADWSDTATLAAIVLPLVLAPQAQARETAKFKVLSISNFTVVDVPGEVTVSRSATYQQTNYMDLDTGEVFPGCYNELSAVDCATDTGTIVEELTAELKRKQPRR